jgi:hypothetical protein
MNHHVVGIKKKAAIKNAPNQVGNQIVRRLNRGNRPGRLSPLRDEGEAGSRDDPVTVLSAALSVSMVNFLSLASLPDKS